MMWRKGCLCGCLIEDECRYIDRTPAPTVTVAHVIHHHAQPPTVEPVVVAGEWSMVDDDGES